MSTACTRPSALQAPAARPSRGRTVACVVGVAGLALSMAPLSLARQEADPAASARPTATTPAPRAFQPTFRIDMRDQVALSQIVDLIRKDLGIQVIYTDDLSSENVYLPAPVEVPGDRVLDFLVILLEQKGYTLVKNEFGIFMIMKLEGLRSVQGEGDYSSTQVIDTRGIKPSALQTFVSAIGGLATPVYADEFGVIIVTDSPGKIRALRQLIDSITAARDQMLFNHFEVKHISAVAARDRVLQLIGEMSPSQGQGVGAQQGVQPNKQPGTQPGVGAGGVVSTSSNLSFQLMVDAQSNSLVFRGRPEEREYVRQLLELVDVPNKMRSVFYEVGVRAAEVIAFQGSREGLGDSTTFQSAAQGEEGLTGIAGVAGSRQFQQQQQQQLPGQQQGQGQQQTNTAGFVIYPEAGGFMYHGTEEQHARIQELSVNLQKLSHGDLVTMEFYKLKHAKAADVVEIVGSLLGEGGGTGNTGSLLGSDLARGGRGDRSSRSNRQGNRGGVNQPGSDSPGSGSSGGGIGAVGDEETSVIEDYKNNQVIVKTRQRLQPEFAKLIQRLDARRPQVYVSAQIVAVTDSQNNRLAVETQILAGQFGLNTNFGLGTLGDDFFNRKGVGTTLPGITAAVVRSDFVPFIITAIQNNTDSKILATPQLLVDDNEPATVLSENEVPTQVTRTSDNGDVTSVGEPSRAGTSLEVTPQISENAVKLDIFIEQSAFTGEPTATLPPPVQRNNLSSLVTVPRDCTIVIGGLTFESDTKTVVKIPLLGDIPLAGLLFRDTLTRKQRTTLYVFLTPTIMTDPTFADLRLLTKGPAAEIKLDSDHIMPPPSLVPMPIGNPIVPAPMPEAEMLVPVPRDSANPAPSGPTPAGPLPINEGPRDPDAPEPQAALPVEKRLRP